MYFRIVSNSFNEVKLVDFLTHLRREFRGRHLILIWDGLPSHRSRLMTEYLEGHKRRLAVVRLPAYAPEINPVESVWANISGQELANRCADDLGPMVEAVRNGFARIHRRKSLARSFLTHAGLSF
jgi:transposase